MNEALRRCALVGAAWCLCLRVSAQAPSLPTPSTQTPSSQTSGTQAAKVQIPSPDLVIPPSPSTPADASSETPGSDTPAPDVASQVRIVRLSQVRGKATLERSAGEGFAPAFANIPVITGARLRTQDGVAEVEFEDGSTLRLTPHSAVDFRQLGRSGSGATISDLAILDGSIYVSLARTKGSVFTLVSGKTAMQLSPGTHLRLDVSASGTGVSTALGSVTDATAAVARLQSVVPATGVVPAMNNEPNASLAVFDGEVDFSSPVGHSTLTRKRTLSFSTTAGSSPVLAAHVAEEPFDQWDKEGVQYQKRYMNAAFGGSGSFYGASDLNYYGGFVDLPGCGQVWRPYFASAAWDPYDNGIWAWYGNAGYSWVSPYPWGWLPFHTGAWQFCGGGGGWGWRPGGAWYGLGNHPGFFRPIVYGVKQPIRPPLPPAPGRPRLAAVNVHPLAVSTLTPAGEFVFHKDSAGFGIPRESFRHLGRESAAVDRAGFARSSLDVERFALPSSNRAATAAWTTNHTAWAEAHPGEEGNRNKGGAAPANALRSGTPSSASNGTPRGSWGGNGGSPTGHSAPAGPSPSFQSAPAAQAPSFHSSPAAAPAAGAAHGK